MNNNCKRERYNEVDEEKEETGDPGVNDEERKKPNKSEAVNMNSWHNKPATAQ